MARHRLSSKDIEHRVSYLIKGISVATRTGMRRQLNRKNITVSQWSCMYVLYEHPGLSGAELGRRAFVSRQAMLKTLKQMRESGWIIQEPSTNGGRLGAVHLTSAGRSVFENSYDAGNQIEATMLASLTAEEEDQLIELLGRCGKAIGVRVE